MENERLARVEEKCTRIPHIEEKLDRFIEESRSRWEKSGFQWGKMIGAVLMINFILGIAAMAVFGR